MVSDSTDHLDRLAARYGEFRASPSFIEAARGLVVLSVAAALAACGGSNGGGVDRAVDGAGHWRRISPASAGVDPTRLAAAERLARRGAPPLRALLVVRRGQIVLEDYFGRADTPSNTYSVTKSVLSLAIGIALGDGKIDSLDQTLADYLPEARAAGLDPRVARITLRDLLEMRAGFRMSTYSGTPGILARPFDCAPGSCFLYDGAVSQLLSAVETRAVGVPVSTLARQRLFEPLGIPRAQWSWPTNREGDSYGNAGLALTARAMAKIGYLALRGGRWNGKHIVPTAYIEDATRTHVRLPTLGYGYQFWTTPDGSGFLALGVYGQTIGIFPQEDLVVVTKADPDVPPYDPRLLIDRIRAAARK